MSVNSVGYLSIDKTIVDKTDNSKQLILDLSSITAGSTRKLIVPDFDTTIIGTTTTDSLSNKTIVGTTNIVDANALKTTGASVNVSSADPPVVGSVLTASTTSAATWSTNNVPNIFFNNLGTISKPLVGNIKQYYGRVNTSNGTAVFNVTTDGTVLGTGIYTNLASAFMYASCIANQTNSNKMPVVSIRSVVNNQVTVNVLRGNNALLTVGLNYSPLLENDVNCEVYLYVVGA